LDPDEFLKDLRRFCGMKVFEALALKKSVQNQLAQLISLRNSTFEYPEDEKPDFDFEELTKRIKEKVNEVTGLKLAIMKAWEAWEDVTKSTELAF
jgi:hypothetical protein